ncbi:MAG TPA: iron chelate uptake ABC transporter family permease subunit [Verrucomicrobiota bacterium]|nr:iron chelate uptake ABC transporter family permease subunit [Verrucomicrobiota bacterium]HRT08175.1 iron chelate uptake ABC transporter family permease subunit [Candidatus Paceibacterota bacterium]
MSEIFVLLKWPLIASLLLPWLLVYLGLHIVQRGVIFVDLALAQTAALGTCVAMLAGYDLHDWQSFPFSLGFTLLGAVVLTFTRTRHEQVPQEALIGILYVVAAAAAVLVLSHTAGGKEELQRSLVGELLVVPPAEVIKTFFLYLTVGVIHFLLRKKFLAISTQPAMAAAAGLNIRWWDFLFYLLFGLVVTSFVHIGGVLLTFSYLVIPAVCAIFLVNSLVARFVVGWAIATAASIASLLVTTRVDLPIGAATVCALGLSLLIVSLAATVSRRAA